MKGGNTDDMNEKLVEQVARAISIADHKVVFDGAGMTEQDANAMRTVYDGYCEQWASRMPDSIRRQASATVPPCARTISASRSLPIISSGVCFLNGIRLFLPCPK